MKDARDIVDVSRHPPTGAMPLTWGGKPAIWMAWTGNNPLSDLLALCLASVRRHNGADFEVIVVTPENLRQYVDPHPAYEYLSLNHRSDYLRLWLLHRYGGMYFDMDTIALRSMKDLYAELSEYDLVTYGAAAWGEVFGFGAFGPTRRGSVLTHAWSEALESLLDRRHDDLAAYRQANPGHGGDCLEWSEVCGGQVIPIAYRLVDEGLLSARLLEPTWVHFAEGGPAYNDLFQAGSPQPPDTELLVLNHSAMPDAIRRMSWSETLNSELGICHLLRQALGRSVRTESSSCEQMLMAEALADMPAAGPTNSASSPSPATTNSYEGKPMECPPFHRTGA